jgi:type II secretion system protein G
MKKGFTLIELLVVIAIIALLASIVVSSLQSARRKANDTRRLADVQQIRTALELWYDTNGSYPPYTENECGGTEGYTTSGNNFLQQLVTAGLLPEYPVDPAGTNCNYQYAPLSSNQGYVVYVKFQSLPRTGACSVGDTASGWSCFGVNMPW